jgi:hypothetical protein
MALKILARPLTPNGDLSKILDFKSLTKSPISTDDRSSIALAYEASGAVWIKKTL